MNIIFHAHSGLRWLILLGVILIIVRSLTGLVSNGAYTKFDKIVGSATVGIMDLQLLLGIVLYFGYSAYTMSLSFNMSNSEERFWSVEHLALMVMAIGLAHVGKVKAGKAITDKSKFKTQAIFFTISFLLMILAIPWGRM